MLKNLQKYFAAAILLSAVSSYCGRAEAKLFDLSEFKLKNGMQVIVIPNHKAPIIKHMVWYKAGSVDEPRGKGGTAHLLEHLMFRGTEKAKDGEFNRLINENGGDSNAFTSLDYTAYHQLLDISKLELAMALEADRMQNLQISDEAFNKEREIVFQERKQMIDNNPLAYFGESLRKLLWQDHPYGLSVAGASAEIKAIAKDDVENFYQQFYVPNNAILILSGDIDPQTAERLAEKYYGAVESRPLGKKAEFPKLNRRFEADLEMGLPQVSAPRMITYYLAPSVNEDKSSIYALNVLANYLGGGETSKLYKKLVDEQKLALGVSVAYDADSRSYGTFSLSVIPREGVSQADLKAGTESALKEALAGINLDEIEKIKQKMLAGLVYLRDNPGDAAYITGAMAAVGYDMDEINLQDEKLRAVSYREVKEAADKLFKMPRVTGWIHPLKGGQ